MNELEKVAANIATSSIPEIEKAKRVLKLQRVIKVLEGEVGETYGVEMGPPDYRIRPIS